MFRYIVTTIGPAYNDDRNDEPWVVITKYPCQPTIRSQQHQTRPNARQRRSLLPSSVLPRIFPPASSVFGGRRNHKGGARPLTASGGCPSRVMLFTALRLSRPAKIKVANASSAAVYGGVIARLGAVPWSEPPTSRSAAKVEGSATYVDRTLPSVPVVDGVVAEALVSVLVVVVDAAISVALQEIARCIGRDGRLRSGRRVSAEAAVGTCSRAGSRLREDGISVSSVRPKGGHRAAAGHLNEAQKNGL